MFLHPLFWNLLYISWGEGLGGFKIWGVTPWILFVQSFYFLETAAFCRTKRTCLSPFKVHLQRRIGQISWTVASTLVLLYGLGGHPPCNSDYKG